MPRWIATIVAVGTLTAVLMPDAAHASQGPGVTPGTASAFVQAAMAFVVYGCSAATILTALALRVARGH